VRKVHALARRMHFHKVQKAVLVRADVPLPWTRPAAPAVDLDARVVLPECLERGMALFDLDRGADLAAVCESVKALMCETSAQLAAGVHKLRVAAACKFASAQIQSLAAGTLTATNADLVAQLLAVDRRDAFSVLAVLVPICARMLAVVRGPEVAEAAHVVHVVQDAVRAWPIIGVGPQQ
jgi:hypothetical protein